MDPKQSELSEGAKDASAKDGGAEGAEDRRSVTEIRHDIQRTRADLDRTVDALGKKLQPSRIAWEARRRVEPELREAGRTLGKKAKRHPGALVAVGAALAGLLLARKVRRRRKKKGSVRPATPPGPARAPPARRSGSRP